MLSQKFRPVKGEKSSLFQTFRAMELWPLDIIPISTEKNILSILCIFFRHDFKTEVADLVRKYILYLLSELQELVKRTKQKYFEDTLTTEKENMQTKLIPVQIKQQGTFLSNLDKKFIL